jgi:hypothetical protein
MAANLRKNLELVKCRKKTLNLIRKNRSLLFKFLDLCHNLQADEVQ